MCAQKTAQMVLESLKHAWMAYCSYQGKCCVNRHCKNKRSVCMIRAGVGWGFCLVEFCNFCLCWLQIYYLWRLWSYCAWYHHFLGGFCFCHLGRLGFWANNHSSRGRRSTDWGEGLRNLMKRGSENAQLSIYWFIDHGLLWLYLSAFHCGNIFEKN